MAKLELFTALIQKIGETQSQAPHSYRLFHGRGGCYEGLEHICVDQFGEILLVTLFKEEECFNLLLEMLSKTDHKKAYIQKRYLQRAEIECFKGQELEVETFAKWNDLKFHLNFHGIQNLGYFLDMEKGRQYVHEHSKGAKILNLFSFTCALSVIAKDAGAESVLNVDMSKGVLKRGRENHQLNGHDLRSVSFLSHDIMKSMGKLTKLGPFDGIILDPPTSQGKSFQIEKDYPKILRRISSMLAPGAWLMACVNSPFLEVPTIKDWFKSNCEDLDFQKIFYSCHSFEEVRDSSGLKVLIYKKT